MVTSVMTRTPITEMKNGLWVAGIKESGIDENTKPYQTWKNIKQIYMRIIGNETQGKSHITYTLIYNGTVHPSNRRDRLSEKQLIQM